MSHYEDEKRQEPVVGELLRGSQRDTTNSNDGWENKSWTQNSTNKVYTKTDKHYDSDSNRFEDQGCRYDDTMSGGGSSAKYNGAISSHGIIPRPNRGLEDKRDGVHGINDRTGKTAILHGERQRRGETGFGYDCYGFAGSSSERYQNAQASQKFLRTNFSSSNGSNATCSFGNQAKGRPQNIANRCCFNCGEPGHIARNCKRVADTRAIGEEGCFKCGEDGHFARECVNASSGFVTRNRLRGSGYVPREEDDFDILYKNGISSGINFERYEY